MSDRRGLPTVHCQDCGQRVTQFRLVPATTWYNIFDIDSAQFEFNAGNWKNKTCTRDEFDMAWAKRNVYSPVYGKIFPCSIPYCYTCLPTR